MEWIKVSERRPKDEQWCWIFIPPTIIINGCYDQECGGWFYGAIGTYWPSEGVTHWMPYYTPEAPKDV